MWRSLRKPLRVAAVVGAAMVGVATAGARATYVASDAAPPHEDFTFGRGQQANRLFSLIAEGSRPNPIATDPVDGPPSTYLLCWEDQLAKPNERESDDLLIEVKVDSRAPESAADMSEPLLIPLPPALWSGLGGLAGMGAIRVWRRSFGRPR